MKTSTSSAVVIASLCLASTASGADQSTNQQADHAISQAQAARTVNFKHLPAPVQATLAREGDRVEDVRQQTGNGSTVYEATISKHGKNYQLKLVKDGTILEREPAGDRQ